MVEKGSLGKDNSELRNVVGRKGIMVGYIKTGKGRVGHDMKKRAG